VRPLTDIDSSVKDELPLETPNGEHAVALPFLSHPQLSYIFYFPEGFAILTPERTFYLGADSAQDRARWVEAMKEYIRSKSQSNGHGE